MVIRCPDCRTEYSVKYEGGMTPGARVRCPRCRVVFPLPRATLEPSAAVATPVRRRISDPQLARRLARAMLSEIVLNRRTERDTALENGNLLARFGPAISTAYRVYGEKVTPELPGLRRIFREAVNDIVGGGKPIL